MRFALAALLSLFMITGGYAQDNTTVTEKAIDKGITALEKSGDLVEAVSTALANAAEKYGPKATELTLESARILAAQDLVRPAIGTFFGLCILSFGLLLFRHGWKINDASDRTWKRPGDVFEIVGVFSIAFSFFVLLLSVCNLIDIRSWVGLWHPDLYIATGIVEKFVN